MTDFLFCIYDHIANFFRNDFFRKINLRTLIMIAAVIMTGCVLIYRLFVLQIVNGENYLDNFQLRIRREVSISSTRGNICTTSMDVSSLFLYPFYIITKDTKKETPTLLHETFPNILTPIVHLLHKPLI